VRSADCSSLWIVSWMQLHSFLEAEMLDLHSDSWPDVVGHLKHVDSFLVEE